MRRILREFDIELQYDKSKLAHYDQVFYAEIDRENGVHQVRANEAGWIRCPHCGKSFKWNSSAYRDSRHVVCYTKLILED